MRGMLTATLCMIPLTVQAQDATTHHDHDIMEQSAPTQSDPPLKITKRVFSFISDHPNSESALRRISTLMRPAAPRNLGLLRRQVYGRDGS